MGKAEIGCRRKLGDFGWRGVLLCAWASLPIHSPAEESALSLSREQGALAVKCGNAPVLTYQVERPAASRLSVESACYFHPLSTPKGVVLTEVAPKDHPHHRGAFLAWVEMHGKKDADFWGWGQHAPKEKRRIVNRGVELLPAVAGAADRAEFRVANAWEADGETLVEEKLRTVVRRVDAAHVVELEYTLTADADLTLAPWAFSGFCVRMRKDGKVAAAGPDGDVKRPDPKHTEPKSDWPDAPWYDYTLTMDDGTVAGAAVINHPKNPPTLWHNHRGLRMINPCIVAPGAVTLKAKEPLVLRYCVVAHDGPAPRELLNRLAKEWGEAENHR